MVDNPAEPLRRIRRPELLDRLLRWTAGACGLGAVHGHHVSDVGYDDCNVVLETSTGRYLVKILSAMRSRPMCARYVEIVDRVVAAGVCHPPLRSAHGRVLMHHPESDNQLVVMDFVEGRTFLELQEFPRQDELATIVEQVERIHLVDLAPEPLHDWWAIPNIDALCDAIAPSLGEQDQTLVRAAARAFGQLDLAALPHALSHGDLTKANVMRPDAGGVAVLDFAVANRYPRIHDLAMVAVNLMHGDPAPLPCRIELLASLYGRRVPLTPEERRALPVYVFAAAAMELLGAAREWSLKGNRSAETRYLMDLGRSMLPSAARAAEPQLDRGRQ
jgi:Ser/Thr protein kinase RdoA (MazF antagonist)